MSSTSKPTFVIGDVHGHVDRLQALLVKAGFMAWEDNLAPDLVPTDLTNTARCIQLGDLGHYGMETKLRDRLVWQFAVENPWLRVLVGNHDMAVFNEGRHSFRGYTPPDPRTVRLMHEKAPGFADAAHGYLLTHAGLHPSYVPLSAEAAKVGLVDRAKFMAALINLTCEGASFNVPVRDDISSFRGGPMAQGGILWRDFREDLSDIPQVFGHTRAHNVRQIGSSFCVDIAERDDGNLAGIWLPSMRVVAVGPDYRFVENEHND